MPSRQLHSGAHGTWERCGLPCQGRAPRADVTAGARTSSNVLPFASAFRSVSKQSTSDRLERVLARLLVVNRCIRLQVCKTAIGTVGFQPYDRDTTAVNEALDFVTGCDSRFAALLGWQRDLALRAYPGHCVAVGKRGRDTIFAQVTSRSRMHQRSASKATIGGSAMNSCQNGLSASDGCNAMSTHRKPRKPARSNAAV